MLKRAYGLYRQDWCQSRGHRLEDWDAEHGFDGESFVCMDEFEVTEFTMRAYMETLLPVEDFLHWTAWENAPEIVVTVTGGLVQGVRSTNPFTRVLIADHDILENGPATDDVEALLDAEKRSHMPDMHDVY